MTWILSKALMQDFANSRSLPAAAEESSVESFLDGEQCAPLSGSPTHRAYLFSGRTTDSLPPFLSGMTCKRLTEPDGEDVLTWFLADSHARTFQAQAKAPVSPVRVLDYGVTWRGLFTKYNHDWCLWKTRPSLWEEGLTLSLPTLPRWGSMLDGALWERVMLGRPTYDTASGSLPTPVKYDSHGTWESNNYHGLGWKAKHEWAKDTYPTPMVSDGKVGKTQRTLEMVQEGTAHDQLARRVRAVQMGISAKPWPTPMCTGLRGGSGVPKDLDARLQGLPVAPKAEDERRVKLWPTPVKNEGRAAAYTPETSYKHFVEGNHQVHLAQVVRDVRMFPTPTGRDGDKKQGKKPPERVRITASGLPEADRPSGTGAQLSLAQAAHVADGTGRVKLLPTPLASNGLRADSKSEHWPGKWQQPGHVEYGELNAEWVEWIMGWPIGWTSLEPMDPRAFEFWLHAQAGRENGLGVWWLADPSDDPESGIGKTIKPKDKADDEIRVNRIAALGNGQVSAVVAAVTHMLWRISMPDINQQE